MNLKKILGEKQNQKVRTKDQGANWSPSEILWTTKLPLPTWSPNTTNTPQCPKLTRENLRNNSTWIWPLWPFMIIKVTPVAPVYIYQWLQHLHTAWAKPERVAILTACSQLWRGALAFGTAANLFQHDLKLNRSCLMCLKGRKMPFWVHLFFFKKKRKSFLFFTLKLSIF